MIRQAVLLKLKPGALAEYRRYHDNLWPELAQAIREAGITQITSFEYQGLLFMYSEVADEGAWDRLWSTDIHARWGEVMSPLLEWGDDNKVKAEFLPMIFNFDA